MRADHDPIDVDEHKHSWISFGLRAGVMDSLHWFDAVSAFIQSWASLNSHPKVDVEKIGEGFKNKTNLLLTAIPYWMEGKTPEEAGSSSKMALVKRFEEYKNRVMKLKS